jgi:hypothetical protein
MFVYLKRRNNLLAYFVHAVWRSTYKVMANILQNNVAKHFYLVINQKHNLLDFRM